VIVLVGFMGAGKSTVGPLLAAGLDLPFADLDLVIEQQQRRSVQEIFAADGEAAFRVLEHETLAAFLRGPGAVLAVGGGAAEHEGSRRLLRAAQVVYLEVDYAEALRRVGGDAGRPMLARPDLAVVYQRRLAVYQEVATLTVAPGGRAARAVCLDVMNGLAGLTQGERAGYSH
jgi:shikimate kinase / 3-dehydroquinate synthase